MATQTEVTAFVERILHAEFAEFEAEDTGNQITVSHLATTDSPEGPVDVFSTTTGDGFYGTVIALSTEYSEILLVTFSFDNNVAILYKRTEPLSASGRTFAGQELKIHGVFSQGGEDFYHVEYGDGRKADVARGEITVLENLSFKDGRLI